MQAAVARYRVLFPLASGGMGVVSLAVLERAGEFARLVAVKRAHPHLLENSTFVRSLVDEARLAAVVRHANVVATLDVEAAADGVTLIMEYVEGASLAELRAATPVVPVAVAGRVLLDVARGLHAAHETRDLSGRALQIVHRDVSPHNVLVGIDGVARLSDFGLAKAHHATLRDSSDAATVKGKLSYMAPEYLESGRCSRQSDVFSLSVVAWELFTGERLFATLDRAVRHRHIVQPASSIQPALPAELDAVLGRGLASAPEQRFETAQQFSDALRDVFERRSLIGTPEDVSQWVLATCGAQLAARRESVSTCFSSAPNNVVVGRSASECTEEVALPAFAARSTASVTERPITAAPIAVARSIASLADGRITVARTPSIVAAPRTSKRGVLLLGLGAVLTVGTAATLLREHSSERALTATSNAHPVSTVTNGKVLEPTEAAPAARAETAVRPATATTDERERSAHRGEAVRPSTATMDQRQRIGKDHEVVRPAAPTEDDGQSVAKQDDAVRAATPSMHEGQRMAREDEGHVPPWPGSVGSSGASRVSEQAPLQAPAKAAPRAGAMRVGRATPTASGASERSPVRRTPIDRAPPNPYRTPAR